MPSTLSPAGYSQSLENWDAYANGGVTADDAEYMRLKDEQIAQYLEAASQASRSPEKLIDVSPKKKKKKKKPSSNTKLLVDLGVDDIVNIPLRESSPEPRARPPPTYASAAQRKKQYQPMNLLD